MGWESHAVTIAESVREGARRRRCHRLAHVERRSLGLQWHVIGMYGPSFFTGRLIARFGASRVVTTGLLLIAGAAAAGLAGTEVAHFWLSLFLLGLGWNFSFLGASALVLECHKPEERTRVQALNDFLVFGMMVVATFASGGLLTEYGWATVCWIAFPPLLFAWLARCACRLLAQLRQPREPRRATSMSEVSTLSMGHNCQPAPAFFSHAEILHVIFGVMICILLAALDQAAVVPAVPAIAQELGAYEQLSWTVAAYLITSTISTLVYGKLSDIYGRRQLLIICIVFFIATSLLCATAQSLSQLIWFRALQGLAGGGLMALTQATIADVVSPRERGRYQVYISAVWAISSLCGPLVGGFVAQHLSWRWIFWINLPIGAGALWVCNKALHRLSLSVRVGKSRLDILGMFLLAGAISVLLLALGWGGCVYPWVSYEILGLVSLGGVLLLLLIVQEHRSRDPLLPPRVFLSSSYVANVTVSTLAATLMFTCVFTIPLYFQLGRGVTATQSGIYVVPFMLASAAGNVVGSRWGRHFGTMRGGLRIAAFIGCAGLALLAALPLNAPLWAVIIAMILAGHGIGVCLIGSITSAQNALTAQDIGAGTGALLVLRSVGGASGSTLAGAIIGSGLIAIRQTADGAMADAATAGAVNLEWSFTMVFAAAALLAATAFLMALPMPNTPLREFLRADPIPD